LPKLLESNALYSCVSCTGMTGVGSVTGVGMATPIRASV
jgi:hypothetical protein